jgi:hypothetical protein
MRRIQFIEIHEQPWFPSSLRDGVTDALQFGFHLLKAYAPIAPLLQSMIDCNGQRTEASQSIVDMCSGGGGPWLDLFQKLRGQDAAGNSASLQIWLSDKYPNLEAFQTVSARSGHHITFYPEPVDARKVPGVLKGPRTMFTSFHHFSPDDARAILQDAVDAGESVGIFELTRRSALTMGLMFVGVLTMFLFTPWIRPFRWSRLFWTYVIPIIPFVLIFDGVVSCLRTYQPQELRAIVEKLTLCQYEWRIGELTTGRIPITYLIGHSSTASEN